jgi:hypothetical protein
MPKRPTFKSATAEISSSGELSGAKQKVEVKFQIDNGDGLQLQSIHDYQKIWTKMGCNGGAPGMLVLNVTLNSSSIYANGTIGGQDSGDWTMINGTAGVTGGKLVGTWTSPYMDDNGPVGTEVIAVHEVRYLTTSLATCVVANGAGRPLSPLLYKL